MEQNLNWTHKLDQVAEVARTFDRSATEDQRLALVDAFGLVACDRFTAQYQLKAMAAGQVSLIGHFKAKGAQPCVVSLEPVPFNLDEEVMVTFAPAHALDEVDPEIEHDALSLEDVESYAGAELNVGAVLFDHFGAALDPYPRAPGAALEAALEAQSDQDQTPHPFAELHKLKGKA